MTLAENTDSLVRLHCEKALTREERTRRELELRLQRRGHGGDTTVPARDIREAVARIAAADGLDDDDRDRVFGAMVRREVEFAEARTLVEGAPVPLQETAGVNSGALVKLMQPGWGASAFYPVETLKRDGPRVFAAGTHMLWDHPTAREENERPWGELDDLAGVLTENAQWVDSGAQGPGLYAKAKIFGHFTERLGEIAQDIGVSIRAYGRGRQGEAEGRQGIIVDELVEALSVDFVPRAGAGGQVVALFEAARRPIPVTARELAGFSAGELREILTTGLRALLSGEDRWIWVVDFTDDTVIYEDEGDDAPDPGYYTVGYTVENRQPSFGFPATKVTRKTVWVPVGAPTSEGGPAPRKEDEMSKELEAKVAELEQQNATLTSERDQARQNEARAAGALIAHEAREAAAGLLADEKIHTLAKTRIAEQVAANPPVKEGTLDRDALKERVEKAVKEEADYLAGIAGNGSVRDLGDTTTVTETATEEQTKVREQSRIDRMRRLGLSEKEAAAAVREGR